MTAAQAAVDRAELEPALSNRGGPARAAITAAAAALDADTEGGDLLRARLMLRLAQVALAGTDYEAAEQALSAALRYAPAGAPGDPVRYLAGVRACRVLLRRGDRETAGATLAAAAAQLPPLASEDDASWRAVVVELALAIAELAVHEPDAGPAAFAGLDELIAPGGPLVEDPRFLDALFTARQLLATHAIEQGDGARAIAELRAVVRIAVDAGSPIDEIEARLALGALLTADPTPVALDEARHHIATARERSATAGRPELVSAALIAEAAVLSHAGKTAAAIDRVLDLARTAARDNDGERYVAAVGIMAELYAQSGDQVSAFRTIAESHHALSAATGVDTTPLFRPLLARLRDRVGEERLAEIAADVDRANRLAAEIDVEKPRHSS